MDLEAFVTQALREARALRVRAIPVDVIGRARESSAGVEVDLDAPLEADEG